MAAREPGGLSHTRRPERAGQASEMLDAKLVLPQTREHRQARERRLHGLRSVASARRGIVCHIVHRMRSRGAHTNGTRVGARVCAIVVIGLESAKICGRRLRVGHGFKQS